MLHTISLQEYQTYMSRNEKLQGDLVYPLSVLEGNQVGQIYVDSSSEVRSALLWHYCGFVYLLGECGEDFLDQVYHMMEENKERKFVVHGTSSVIDQYFQNKTNIEPGRRHYFTYTGKEGKKEFSLPEGFELKELDHELVSHLTGRIIPPFSWKQEEDFLRIGKGYCVTDGATIVSSAFSAAVSNQEIDIGIETNEKYRGRGFAAIVANRMVQYCLDQKKQPVWQCDTRNIGSRKTAEKVGFEITRTEYYYNWK